MERIARLLGETAFAVVDVETTGLSPLNGDRIVEVAVVRLTPDSSTEYATLVNPLRNVGPTHIHGLTAQDVAQAPMFPEIIGDLLELLEGAVMVAHNIRFDREFLSVELSDAGVLLPSIPCLCTLELSYRLEPTLANHRLATCCAAVGVFYKGPHSALADARAETELLRRFLLMAEDEGELTLEALGCEPTEFPARLWPHRPPTRRRLTRSGDGAGTPLPYLAQLVAALGPVSSSAKLAPYMDLLDRVLEDDDVTPEEAEALKTHALDWGLSAEDILAAHHAYLESLVAAAAKGGRVRAVELRHLEMASRLLAIDPSVALALLAEATKRPG